MRVRSEEHTSELQSPCNLVCRLLLEKKKKTKHTNSQTILRSAKHTLRVHVCDVSISSARAEVFFMFPFPLSFHFCVFFFFFNDTATTEIYTLSLHDALPI